MNKLCKECGDEFVASPRGQTKYCLDHSGRAAVVRRHNLTDSHKQSHVKHRKTVKWWASQKRSWHKWARTDKGKLAQSRNNRLRAASIDIDAYQRSYRILILELRSPCNWCGLPATTIDHVEPLAFGRLFGHTDLDEPWNHAPMCYHCHRLKTRMDMSDIMRLRNAFSSAQ